MRELIRCKECKWNKSDKWVDCPITEMFGRTTDNYCSLAERKEEWIDCFEYNTFGLSREDIKFLAEKAGIKGEK